MQKQTWCKNHLTLKLHAKFLIYFDANFKLVHKVIGAIDVSVRVYVVQTSNMVLATVGLRGKDFTCQSGICTVWLIFKLNSGYARCLS